MLSLPPKIREFEAHLSQRGEAMQFKALKAAAVAVTAALALAGCSPSDQQQQAANKEVVLWHMESTPGRVAAFENLAKEYNATNPEYPVRIQVQEWDQVYTKIAGAAQSGQQPDVLFAIPDFATYVRQLGLGKPVTNVVKEIEGESGLIDAATAPYRDGEDYWAVPLYGMVQMLWYRADILKAEGIEPPQTWEELVSAAKALTKDGRSGIALPAGKNLATDQVIYSLMTTANKANLFTEDGNVDINTPEAVKAFDLYKELLQYSPKDSGNYAWGEPQAAFNSGAAAMAIEKGQYLAPFEAESGRPASDLGCAPIPTPADGGQPGSIYYSNGAMVLSEDEAKAAGAGEFLKWIVQPDHYGDFLNAEPGLFLPVTDNGADSEKWRSNKVISTYKTCVDAMLKQSESGELFGFADGQYIEKIGEISGQNFLAQGVQEMYVNKKEAADVVSSLQEQMQGAIAK
jgi:multiple sugar transport system substrate-binding protein